MKKYISPSMTIVQLSMADGVLEITSMNINRSETTDVQYVKGDNSSSSSSSRYNVWDDDWSAE